MPIVSGPATLEDRPTIRLLIAPTEARDEALRNAGMRPERRDILAFLDTGAIDSLIERSLAAELELDPSGEMQVYGVNSGDAPEAGVVFQVRLYHAGVPAVELSASSRVIAVADLSRFGVQMILGRDLLARGVLVYDGPGERFTFAF